MAWISFLIREGACIIYTPPKLRVKIYLEFYTVLVRIFDNMEGLFLKGDIIYLYIMYEFLQNTLKFYDDINCKNKGSYKCNM